MSLSERVLSRFRAEYPKASEPALERLKAIMDEEERVARKEKKKASVDDRARQIYQAYPRHIAPEDALVAITKALKKHEAGYLMDKTSQFAEAVRSWPSSYRYFQDGGDRCPYPATWFNAGRFADDPKEWKRSGGRLPGPQRVQVAAPEGWAEWLQANMPSDDHPSHSQLCAAQNLKKFDYMPPSWQTKCIIELTGKTFNETPTRVAHEQALRQA